MPGGSAATDWAEVPAATRRIAAVHGIICVGRLVNGKSSIETRNNKNDFYCDLMLGRRAENA